MRGPIERYRTIFANKKSEGTVLTIAELAEHAGVKYSAAYEAAIRLMLPCISESQLIENSYRCAVNLCRGRDKDGIVTIEDVALECKVTPQHAWEYFKDRPQLRCELNVLDKHEAKERRLRAAAARIRSRDPDMPLVRKALAQEVGCTPGAMHQYLQRHLKLQVELGIALKSETMSRTTLTSEIIRSQTIAEYGLAASEAAQRDIDSIVTCEDIARRSGVQVESMRRFFRKHPELKKKWGVLDPAEVTEKRYRGAVSRMRSRRGRKRPITRGRLAKELGCTVTSVYEYLRQHPALVQELEITRG